MGTSSGTPNRQLFLFLLLINPMNSLSIAVCRSGVGSSSKSLHQALYHISPALLLAFGVFRCITSLQYWTVQFVTFKQFNPLVVLWMSFRDVERSLSSELLV